MFQGSPAALFARASEFPYLDLAPPASSSGPPGQADGDGAPPPPPHPHPREDEDGVAAGGVAGREADSAQEGDPLAVRRAAGEEEEAGKAAGDKAAAAAAEMMSAVEPADGGAPLTGLSEEEEQGEEESGKNTKKKKEEEARPSGPLRAASSRFGKFKSIRNVFQPQPSRGQASSSAESAAAATSGGRVPRPASEQNVIVQAEDRKTGDVTLSTYVKYLRAGGSFSGITALFLTVLGQLLAMACDYWPRWWAGDVYGDQHAARYVWIFAVLVGACLLVGFLKSVAWFSFSLSASKNLHSSCLWGVLHSPLQFFVANPTGRILNRFSKDQNVVDEAFPVTSYDFLQSAAFCISAVILVCISIPYLTILMAPLAYLFVVFRTRYLRSSREVKRLEATTRSPVYADFSSTLEGLTTVRAYKIEARVTSIFREQVDCNARAWWSFCLLARWLGLRLDMQTAFVLIATVFPAIALKGRIDVGLLGFALVYVLNLSALFQWTVRQSAEVENQMTSVERIQSYSELPPEEGYAVHSPPPAPLASSSSLGSASRSRGRTLSGDSSIDGGAVFDRKASSNRGRSGSREARYQPVAGGGGGSAAPEARQVEMVNAPSPRAVSVGSFDIQDLFVSYRKDLPPVLRQLKISIPKGSKVGVCGRTGSGKSSLLLALLRLNVIQSGDIRFEGRSLLDMSLEEARSLVSVIPQEPHLFTGTIRSNVDPFHVYSDAEIWAALEDAHIKEYISRDPKGLGAAVTEGGKNFSVGQRQLLSLSRAILRRAPIVLMDEVTASIDYQTDRLIQTTIRTSPSLRDATILTIAHRLRTIADSDMIAVINAGELAEVGRPIDLIANDKSPFRALVQESNEFEEIVKIIKDHSKEQIETTDYRL